MDWSRKKGQRISKRRSEALRADWRVYMLGLRAEKLYLLERARFVKKLDSVNTLPRLLVRPLGIQVIV